jgi:uncharacterized protein YuzE
MDGHYDRKADVAWLRLDGWDPERVRVDEKPWGLVELDRDTGRVVGLEYWEASTRLPGELLDALPAPPAREVIVERQRA